MLKSRQVHDCPKLPSPITALSFDFAHGHLIPEHHHQEDQLVYACRGVMTVRTKEGTWVVPAQRAVWIPGRTRHSIVMAGAVSMRTLYLRARIVDRLPRNCCVVNVSPLLQQLILYACQFRALNRRLKTQAHLIDLLIDQLQLVKTVPLQLPMPSDSRAARVAAILQNDPANSAALDEACKRAGASKEPSKESFSRKRAYRWEMAPATPPPALPAIACRGRKDHACALEAGYSTPSAFIAMFRKAFGTTPRRYFENSASART